MGHEEEIQLLFKGLSITENITSLKHSVANVALQLHPTKEFLSLEMAADRAICCAFFLPSGRLPRLAGGKGIFPTYAT